jgi:enoyl-CoA hydratase
MSLSVEILNGNLIVKFVRPEERNPLSVEVLKRLYDAVDSIDGNVKKLIFTGTGDVFASGANLTEVARVGPDAASEFALLGQALMNKIATLPTRTIAAVNGFCFGGALDLALSCKMRIASPNALFSHPGVGLGIITGWGGTQRLPRLIGEAAALEMLLTAGRFDVNWALRNGLVETVADDPLAYAIDHDD